MTIFNQFSSSSRLENKLVYSQFMDQVKSGNIAKVRIDGQNITGTTNNGQKFSTYAPTDPWLVSDLLKTSLAKVLMCFKFAELTSKFLYSEILGIIL